MSGNYNEIHEFKGTENDAHIITISNSGRFRTTAWKMTIDLDELTRSAGKRVKDGYNGGSFVDVPLSRAKRLLKLILEYGTEPDFEKCDRVFRKNEKLYRYWKEMRG